MPRHKPVIGIYEATILLFLFLISKIYLSYSPFLYHHGLNAAWMIPLIQIPLALAGVYLLCKLLEKFPGQSLIEIGENLTGVYINTIFALFYLAFFATVAGLTLRGISERVVAGFLTSTPISLVAILLITSTLVVSYLGIEAVARTAKFLAGVIVVSSLVLIAMTVSFWEFHNIYPFWGSGFTNVTKSSFSFMGDFTNILLLGIIFPFTPPGTVRKIGSRAVILAGLFMFLFVLVPLLIFSLPAVLEINNPSFLMARIINIGRFAQRMEVIFLPVWVFVNLLSLSVSLYAGGAITSRMLRLNDYRPFILSTTVFVFTIAFIPQNIIQTFEWANSYITRFSFAPFMAIILFLLLAARVKKKGGLKNAKNT